MTVTRIECLSKSRSSRAAFAADSTPIAEDLLKLAYAIVDDSVGCSDLTLNSFE